MCFLDIYNLPKYFDVPEQPLLTLDNFNECVQTAFAKLSEMVKDAASYVSLSYFDFNLMYTPFCLGLFGRTM